MLQSKAVETAVGVFVALGLAALFVLAMQVSNLSFAGLRNDSFYEVRAEFENIGGLKVRSPVKMAGVTIGRIGTIEFDSNTYNAIVIMRIDKHYDRIPDDSGANIYTAGLLGEQYVGLTPGGSEEFLKAGAVITETQSAVVLEQLIGQFFYSQASKDQGAPQ
ncbi:MAG: outer membrane lipid asymmetry maintenance protein MlaD [Beggiatoa sp.]|nr:outer membrane lipid asymmetry maintenance protein MlaD [Beggiatoa sp.]